MLSRKSCKIHRIDVYSSWSARELLYYILARLFALCFLCVFVEISGSLDVHFRFGFGALDHSEAFGAFADGKHESPLELLVALVVWQA